MYINAQRVNVSFKTIRGPSMNRIEEKICKLTKKACNDQLRVFTQIVRQKLLDAGIESSLLEKSLKDAIMELKNDDSYLSECSHIIHDISKHTNGEENRGIDSIGRVLVEYCFFRTPSEKMIWPDNSKKDMKARAEYTQNVIPRPLMRYFLVSVRGTIAELNNFEASSVLFGEENTAHEERKSYVDELIQEFKVIDKTGQEITNWQSVYADTRFQQVALELIGDIRRKIEQFGLERYLRILENFRQRDPDSAGINAMQRPFIIEDAKQIDEALWAAEEALALVVK